MKGHEFIDPDTGKLIADAEASGDLNTEVDTCTLCNVHTQASNKLPEDKNLCFKCPTCENYINFDNDQTPILGDDLHIDIGFVYSYCSEYVADKELLDCSQIIGETNSNHLPLLMDENFERGLVLRCPHCDGTFTPVLMPITHNANHDVFYTGGKAYITELQHRIFDTEINTLFKDKIKQYTDRIKSGETNLDETHLTMWLERAMERCIATTLYKLGYKK